MKKLKYRCLVLDHDNTVAATTPDIQYPALLYAMRQLGIDFSITEEEFIRREYEGLRDYVKEALHLDSEAAKRLETVFYEYVKTHPAKFYGGMDCLIKKHIALGGSICVVSTSPAENIRRDYRENRLPDPDIIFGVELEANRHKPNPYPLEEIMRVKELQPSALLVVDDKMPGLSMARACGISSAIAGWGLADRDIKNAMKNHCGNSLYLDTVNDFYEYLFEEKLQ